MIATLTVLGKPFTSNDERRSHWRTTAKIRRDTRQHARLLTLATIKRGTAWVWPVTVTVVDECRTARLRDVGAAAPHVKAIIDGITDSGRIWLDDSPDYVGAIQFLAPRKTGTDQLVIEIRSADG